MTISRALVIPVAFAAGMIAMAVIYPAVDFVKACRTALSRSARPAAASVAPDTAVNAAFAGVSATPAEGVVLGDSAAPAVLYVFNDFECPFCARWASQVKPEVVERFVETGQLRMIYMDFPLPNHPRATPAAMAARCAGDQGRYWEYHDLLFANQEAWIESDRPSREFMEYAEEVGVDAARFSQCMRSADHRLAIVEGVAYARRMGARGTPWFYLNGRRISGTVESLDSAIARELAAR